MITFVYILAIIEQVAVISVGILAVILALMGVSEATGLVLPVRARIYPRQVERLWTFWR